MVNEEDEGRRMNQAANTKAQKAIKEAQALNGRFDQVLDMLDDLIVSPNNQGAHRAH